ncbi:MAG TPA: AAA family ATPase [Candidatus Angelobacter sp.]
MMLDIEEKTVPAAEVEREAVERLLVRVRLRARRRILWMRATSNQAHGEDLRGFAIAPEEVERILEDPAEAAAKEETFYRSDPAARRLSEQIIAADQEFLRDAAWNQLRQQFVLSDFETDLLSLLVAAAVDPGLRRVYAYLHDDMAAAYATPWLAARLFDRFSPISLGPESALVKWRLARPIDQTGNLWAANTPWLADPHITLWLLGHSGADPALGSSVQFLPKAESARKLCLYPEQLEEMLEFLRVVSSTASAPQREPGPAPVELELIGKSGTGKRTLASQFAASLGADLVAVDADSLLEGDIAPAAATELIIRVLRMARLLGAVLYWQNSERLGARLWQATGGYSGVMLFGRQSPGAASAESAAARHSWQIPALRRDMRCALWRRLSSQAPPHIIEDWVLTAAELVRAAQMAPAGMNATIQACQEDLRLAASELFMPLVCPFGWDDIVLPPHLRLHLGELEQQVRLRWRVYEDWGFERLCPLGRGITALFSGPSGTGKTMAAQVLARSLDMKLYRVDLAGVMNKYIGETEKRLKQVFDACERANVLLFFDEADALFGQRTQVKDAHDRFANIEIDYLLQRMEQFEGVAVLATNRKGDLDKAFLRRIRFIVDFIPPGPAERLALWQRTLLPCSPRGEELLDRIDFNFLAHKLNLTGAGITAAALGAAFLAHAEGRRIAMSHVLHAARREMSKQGVVIRPGEWEI